MARPVLKGGISYNRYVWHTDDGACDECQALDGMEFDYVEDIPDRPHPNCKCWVEVIENGNYEGDGGGTGNGNGNGNGKGKGKGTRNPKPKEEPCDCLDDLFEEVDALIGDGETLQEDIETSIGEFSTLLHQKYIQPVKNLIENCIDSLEEIRGAISDFIENYNDMKKANTIGADKYFHSKANCDASQRGELAEEIAKGISDLRELTDHYKNIYIKGMSEAASAKDTIEDQKANEYGREQGHNNPIDDCRDLIKIYRPRGLPEKY